MLQNYSAVVLLRTAALALQ